MSNLDERVDSTKDKLAGKTKKVTGKLTGDKTRVKEGQAQDLLGTAKNKWTDTKETAKDTLDKLKKKLNSKDHHQ